ncbi:MAG: A24 family peptidase [Polyangiales bacterium]
MVLHAQHWLTLGAVAIAALAAISDYRTGLIPNRLVGFGFLALFVLRVAAALLGDPSQLATSLGLLGLGMLISALIPLTLYICRALGAGDVKLMAVCGAGLGPVAGLEAEFYAFGFGALYALAHSAYSGVLLATLRGSALLLTNPLIPRRLRKPVPVVAQKPMRFGPAICAGVIAAAFLHWSAP